MEMNDEDTCPYCGEPECTHDKKGRRVYGDLFAPGDYGKDSRGVWCCRPPDERIHLGSLEKHAVVEHEDGTITVSPSIAITEPTPQGDIKWHGYLEKGVWRVVVLFLLLASPLHADDGKSFIGLMDGLPDLGLWRGVLQIEHVEGNDFSEGKGLIPAYLQLVTADTRYVWYYGTGEEELYDMTADPYQLQNIALSTPLATMNLYRGVAQRLKVCSGPDCFTRMPVAVFPVPASKFNSEKISVYPNPFNPETRIEFDYSGPVDVKVFNVLGQEVWNWQGLWPGQVVFDGTRLSSGVYMLRVLGETTRMMLVK